MNMAFKFVPWFGSLVTGLLLIITIVPEKRENERNDGKDLLNRKR
jgi:hypothetical protein